MMDDDADFEIVIEPALPPARFQRVQIVSAALLFTHGMARAVMSTCDFLMDVLDQHTEFVAQQRAFHSQAAREIEAITAGEDQ